MFAFLLTTILLQARHSLGTFRQKPTGYAISTELNFDHRGAGEQTSSRLNSGAKFSHEHLMTDSAAKISVPGSSKHRFQRWLAI